MSRHRREVRLLAILARLGWQRDPDLWTIPCLDGHGRRAHLSVRVGLGWVRLDCPASGLLYLNPFHALRLHRDPGWPPVERPRPQLPAANRAHLPGA